MSHSIDLVLHSKSLTKIVGKFVLSLCYVLGYDLSSYLLYDYFPYFASWNSQVASWLLDLLGRSNIRCMPSTLFVAKFIEFIWVSGSGFAWLLFIVSSWLKVHSVNKVVYFVALTSCASEWCLHLSPFSRRGPAARNNTIWPQYGLSRPHPDLDCAAGRHARESWTAYPVPPCPGGDNRLVFIAALRNIWLRADWRKGNVPPTWKHSGVSGWGTQWTKAPTSASRCFRV